MTLIDNFQTDAITVTRFEKGEYQKGVYIEGNKLNLELIAVVLPMTGRELRLLTEGQRATEAIIVYTDERLFTVKDSEAKKADLVEWRGDCHQVQKVEDWTKTDLGHYKALAMRVEANADNRRAEG